MSSQPIVVAIEPARVDVRCPVPVRAKLARLDDNRNTSGGPDFLGYRRTRHSLDLLYAQRPVIELVRDSLHRAFADCAASGGASTAALTVEVALENLVFLQEADLSPVRTGTRIDLSTKVVDESGKEVDSFVVHVKNETFVEAGMHPDPKIMIEGLLDEAADKMMWQLVPAIRRQGG